MSEQYGTDTMLDMYIFETTQNVEQLEMCILESENTGSYTKVAMNEIFRMMHTIKGSSAMMLFNNISILAHSMEDLFFFIREQNPEQIDYVELSNLIFEGVDFIKIELHKIKTQGNVDGDPTTLIEEIKAFLEELKQKNPTNREIELSVQKKQQHYYIAPNSTHQKRGCKAYKATIFFEDGCEMENIRAYTVLHNLQEVASELTYVPEDIIENEACVEVIRNEGFQVLLETDKSYEEMHAIFSQTIFLKELMLEEIPINEVSANQVPINQVSKEKEITNDRKQEKPEKGMNPKKNVLTSSNQSMISVNVAKLDKLMDLVGEMVIAEAMVTQNPDLKGLELENFYKASRQLHKITSELQDTVMAIRMVPLTTTFQKMQRIVRDMSKKLGKEVKLQLIGEETEVDKNIIEHIADPLMHLVRNAIDHGIEEAKEREKAGKTLVGNVTLEAKNAGSDVLILVKDDGKGLSKEGILKRARENGLLTKSELELTEEEIYNLIFFPGFSTKENVTEFSGRGVGMDVVMKNIEAVGGVVSVESKEGMGSTITIKIPLTLAIIDGMNIQVGNARYTIPITTIKQSFRPKEADLITDPDGNEMIMVRGGCYPILRLHSFYQVETKVTDFTKGIFIMVEQDKHSFCIFADQLLGQQQVVVKSLPDYIKTVKKIQGLAGCTLLGDGSISLILNISGLAT